MRTARGLGLPSGSRMGEQRAAGRGDDLADGGAASGG
jgi:hypothetical protein